MPRKVGSFGDSARIPARYVQNINGAPCLGEGA